MNLESLANELVLDIFEFLKAVHLLPTFHGLNSRFNDLLVIHFQTHSLDFRSVFKHDFDIVCQQHLPSIAHQISALRLSDDDGTPRQPHLFLSHGLTLRQLTRLRSLSLSHLRSIETMDKLTLKFSHLSHLTHLILTKCYFDKDATEIFNNIWSLPVLVLCYLDITFMDRCSVPAPTVISSSLERLSVEDDWYTLIGLANLFQSTPHLRNLSVSIHGSSDTQWLPQIIPSITILKLSFDESPDVLTTLLQNMPNLCHLTIEIQDKYLDGTQWEELTVNYLPRLKVFRFGMTAFYPADGRTIEEQVDELLDSFKSPFWLDVHQWFVRCDYDRYDLESAMCLYSLPYPFDEFLCLYNMQFKSTCPADRNYWSYDRVHTFWSTSSASRYISDFPIRFSNIRRLELSLPFNEYFWSVFPSFNRLTSLDVRSSFYNKNDNHTSLIQLRTLLDRAPRLYSVTTDHLLLSSLVINKSTDTSIRRLDLRANNQYFYGAESVPLIQSLLNGQCEVILINVKNRAIVLDLVHKMANLRALTFRCRDDTWKIYRSSSIENKLVPCLQQRLPSTCSIIKKARDSSVIRLWIR